MVSHLMQLKISIEIRYHLQCWSAAPCLIIYWKLIGISCQRLWYNKNVNWLSNWILVWAYWPMHSTNDDSFFSINLFIFFPLYYLRGTHDFDLFSVFFLFKSIAIWLVQSYSTCTAKQAIMEINRLFRFSQFNWWK